MNQDVEEKVIEILDEVSLNTMIRGLAYDKYAERCSATPALRSSNLRPLMRSPAHLVASLSEPRQETEALRQGKLIHKLFEDPEKFMDTIVIEPEFTGFTQDGRPSARSKEAKENRAKWYASQPDRANVLTADDVSMVRGIWSALKGKRLIRSMLADGVSESSLFARDPQTGVMVACRPDFISKHGHVVDIKSTIDASRDYFLRTVFSSSRTSPFYILQSAHYAHCMRISGIGSGESFTFIALEKSPPYEMQVYPMDTGCLAVGEQWRDKLTKVYADCLAKGEWPGYEDRAVPVSPPQWAQVPDDWE